MKKWSANTGNVFFGTVAACVLLSWFFPCPDSAAGQWPNYLGPGLDGVSKESGWVAEWAESGPEIIWEKKIGVGFSSMAVSEGRLYTMGNIDDTDIVYCLDAASGDEIWTHSYPEPLNPKSYEGGPNATCTLDGGRVYTLSKKGRLFCLDAKTGEVVWDKNLQEEYGVEEPTWGLAGSPMVLGDILILNAGTCGMAFDKADGRLVWENGTGPAGYATPKLFNLDGKEYVAIFAARSLAVVEPKTGRIVWRHPWKTSYDVNSATPVVSGDTVFISSGYGKGCALLRLSDGGVEEIYFNKNMKNQINTSVLWEGYLYGFDGQVKGGGQLACLEYDTGNVMWTQSGLGTGSLFIADGRLIILGEKGTMVIAEASPEGYRELARAKPLEGKCWTMPILAEGRIYARSNPQSRLVCIGLERKKTSSPAYAGQYEWPQFRGPDRNGKSSETGLMKKWPDDGPKMLWSVDGLGTGFASAAIAGGRVYTTGLDSQGAGYVFSYDLDGNLKWKESYGRDWDGSHKGARTTPTIEGDRLYLYSGYGVMTCMDSRNGKTKWQLDTFEKFGGKNIKWGITESVLVHKNMVFCTPGGENATMVALDKADGRTIWTTKGLSETSAYCSPVIIQRNGKDLILTMVQESVILVDSINGDVVLRIGHIGKHFISAVTPVYMDGCIYATTGYGGGGVMYQLSPDLNGHEVKWEDKNLDCHHGGLILLEGNVHGSNHVGLEGNKGNWICLDLAAGKVRYTAELVGKGSVIFADGMLYCYGESGRVGLVEPCADGYRMASSFEVTKGTAEHWAHPAVSNGRLYIRHGDAMMVYDIKQKN